MSKAVKDYVKFQVLGIEEDLVSEEDKKVINKLKLRKHILEAAKQDKNKVFVLETYSIEKQQKIFDELKLRQGDKTRITFLNDTNEPVEILGASIRHEKVLLRCRFCKRRNIFNMWLKTFINEIKKGNIRSIRPLKFVAAYFNTIDMSLKETSRNLQLIYDKYNNIYETRKLALKRDFENEIAGYKEVVKEAKIKKELSTEEALEKALKNKGVARIKDYWNTKISPEEKATLLNWLSQSIYSIRVYGLLDGKSGNVLKNKYSEIGGSVRLREVKRNEEGKVVSSDGISAYIALKFVNGAPEGILKKIVSTRRNKEQSIFSRNRICDTNLALFLLLEYKNKGFKAGVRNLYKQIQLN